jgi:hypothetical protein
MIISHHQPIHTLRRRSPKPNVAAVSLSVPRWFFLVLDSHWARTASGSHSTSFVISVSVVETNFANDLRLVSDARAALRFAGVVRS